VHALPDKRLFNPQKLLDIRAHFKKSPDCIERKIKIRSIIPSCHFSIYKPNKYNNLKEYYDRNTSEE